MSETRREIIKNIAMAVTFAGVPADAAQHVHQAVADAKAASPKGKYTPKLFNAHEFATVRRLSELIIPADEVSGSAVQAGAPEFIDLIASHNEEIGTEMLGGVQWLDRAMEKRTGKSFVDSAAADQTALLDQIAYRKNSTPELQPGIVFFDWVRRLTVDAFYTSPLGVVDVEYVGNRGMTKFEIPVAAIEYAVKKSGL